MRKLFTNRPITRRPSPSEDILEKGIRECAMDDLEKEVEEPQEETEEMEVEEEEETSQGGSRTWLIAGLVGLIMLVAGVLLGYIGRGEFGPEAQAAKATSAAEAVLAQTQAAANANLMEYLSQNTRHFKGDPNAAVTIIEFSDFQ
jgi:hypothetical protein